MAEQQQAVDSADTQIFAAKEAAADRRESSPPTSELSVGKMNPQVVTVWNKRVKLVLRTQGLAVANVRRWVVHHRALGEPQPFPFTKLWRDGALAMAQAYISDKAVAAKQCQPCEGVWYHRELLWINGECAIHQKVFAQSPWEDK